MDGIFSAFSAWGRGKSFNAFIQYSLTPNSTAALRQYFSGT